MYFIHLKVENSLAHVKLLVKLETLKCFLSMYWLSILFLLFALLRPLRNACCDWAAEGEAGTYGEHVRVVVAHLQEPLGSSGGMLRALWGWDRAELSFLTQTMPKDELISTASYKPTTGDITA